MPTDLPLSALVSQVISHTPVWAWVCLAVITALGIRQTADLVMTAKRLSIAPVAFGAFSLWGTATSFGVHPQVFATWMAGAALAVLAAPWFGLPAQAQPAGEGRYAVQGSVGPLLAMWAIFGVRYVSGVALVLHPGLAHGTGFSLAMPLVYGALSGVFLARTLRILRTAQPAPSLA
ncbi:MAG TPA: DUF6622 family protein [Burkholderiaceae bacterium]|nr:DUF6622 family protein [Burkholderiaceae bacterium]